MVETVQISLKGENPAWTGLVDISQIAPSSGGFTKMLNCAVSKDGSEIEQWPGTVLAATPGFMDKIPLKHGTGTGFALINSNQGVILTSVGLPNVGHGLQVGNSYTVRLDLEIETNSGQARILRDYTAVAVATNSLKVDEISSADPDPTTWVKILHPSYVYCPARYTVTPGNVQPAIHGLKWVNGQFAVVAESVRFSELPPVQQHRAIAVWHADGVDWTASNEPWDYWPNPANTHPMKTTPNEWRPTRNRANPPNLEIYDYPARRKANLHVTQDDLVIAVPGHGIVLQANLSVVDTELWRAAQYTRLLGVPKGGLFRVDAVETSQAPTKTAFSSGQHVWVAVGYRDRITGAVGLTNSPKQIEFSGSDLIAQIKVCSSRTMLLESVALNPILYTSGVNGGESGPFYPIHEQSLDRDRFNANGLSSGGYTLLLGADDFVEAKSWDQKPQFPVLEQFPMGSSWAVTVRGITFFGGGISKSDGLGIERVNFRPFDLDSGGVNNELNWIRFYHYGENEAGVFPGQLAAGYRVPSSYQGTEIQIPVWAGEPGEPRGNNIRKCRLLTQEDDPNAKHLGSNGAERGFPWKCDNLHWLDKKNVGNSSSADVLLNRGHVQFSELGAPGVTPATNRIIFDRIKGVDTRAAGRLRDSIIICTEEETYRVAWGRSPLGSDPVLVSDTYGCISPNSMVELPTGLAWLSKDGPVFCNGDSVQWIGMSIYETWKTLKRDSQGMMWQAFGDYDTDNMLVIWGVRQDLHTTSSSDDDTFSKQANDTLLIWNAAHNAFSIHKVSSGREIVDIERMPDEAGRWRMFALEEDEKIYQFDPRFRDHVDQVREFTIAVALTPTGSTALLTVTSGTNNTIPVGTKCAVHRAGALVWEGLVDTTAFSASGQTFIEVEIPEEDIAPALEFKVGDTLLVDVTDFELETTFRSFGGFDVQSAINSLVLYHTTEASYPSGAMVRQWAQLTATDGSGNEYRVGDYYGQALDADSRTVFEKGWGGFGLTRLKIKVFGNGHTKIKDMVARIQKAG